MLLSTIGQFPWKIKNKVDFAKMMRYKWPLEVFFADRIRMKPFLLKLSFDAPYDFGISDIT